MCIYRSWSRESGNVFDLGFDETLSMLGFYSSVVSRNTYFYARNESYQVLSHFVFFSPKKRTVCSDKAVHSAESLFPFFTIFNKHFSSYVFSRLLRAPNSFNASLPFETFHICGNLNYAILPDNMNIIFLKHGHGSSLFFSSIIHYFFVAYLLLYNIQFHLTNLLIIYVWIYWHSPFNYITLFCSSFCICKGVNLWMRTDHRLLLLFSCK